MLAGWFTSMVNKRCIANNSFITKVDYKIIEILYSEGGQLLGRLGTLGRRGGSSTTAGCLLLEIKKHLAQLTQSTLLYKESKHTVKYDKLQRNSANTHGHA